MKTIRIAAVLAAAAFTLTTHRPAAAAPAAASHSLSHPTWLVTPADPGAGGAATLMSGSFAHLRACRVSGH